ncbi:MAG: hypothetical protein MZV64_43900 [Ignavibacteriales bacterium]|nr:hypothetical protein [Ignavibacteriales bacterium]
MGQVGLGPRRHPDRPRPDPRPGLPGEPGVLGQHPRQFPADLLRRAVLRHRLRPSSSAASGPSAGPRPASRPRPARPSTTPTRDWPRGCRSGPTSRSTSSAGSTSWPRTPTSGCSSTATPSTSPT